MCGKSNSRPSSRLSMSVASVSFEPSGASFEFGLVDVEEEVVEGGRINEVVADEGRKERKEWRLEARMVTAKGGNVIQFASYELIASGICPDVLMIEVIESAEASLKREDEEVRVVGENRGSKVVGESNHRLVGLEVRHAVKDRKIPQRRQERLETQNWHDLAGNVSLTDEARLMQLFSQTLHHRSHLTVIGFVSAI